MTVTAMEVLSELRARGIEIRAHGEKLRFHPLESVDPILLNEMKRHKTALLELIGCPPPLLCFTCKGQKFWRGEPVRYTDGTIGPGAWVCRACHPPPHDHMIRETSQ